MKLFNTITFNMEPICGFFIVLSLLCSSSSAGTLRNAYDDDSEEIFGPKCAKAGEIRTMCYKTCSCSDLRSDGFCFSVCARPTTGHLLVPCGCTVDNFFDKETSACRPLSDCLGENDICLLNPDSGKEGHSFVDPRVPRFFFDKKSRFCRPLTYRGAGGNMNNFFSFDDCMDACVVQRFSNSTCASGKPASKPNPDACEITRCARLDSLCFVDPCQENGVSYFSHQGMLLSEVECRDPSAKCDDKTEMYRECGPTAACEETCHEPPKQCYTQCQMHCFCKPGFVRVQRGGKCVKIEDCPKPHGREPVPEAEL